MSSKSFLHKENLNMLWDLISDEEIFKFLSRDIQNKISSVFTTNLKGFFENEVIQTTNLMDINKKYIILILNYIKKTYPNQQPNKIKIHEDDIPNNLKKDLITYEEIQNDKKSQFEKDFNKRQQEFTSAMTLKVPEVPEFGDKNLDIPITEMEKMIQEMTAQRNYEVEQINKGFQNQSNDWLKPEETSVKNEKNIIQKQISQSETKHEIENIGNKLKYIKIENEGVSLQSPEKRKNVSWGENIEIKEILDISETKNTKMSEEDNIFKKLKKINATEYETINTANNISQINQQDRIQNLEMEIKVINNKIDMLIDLFKQNK
jgi:hypothetical protein